MRITWALTGWLCGLGACGGGSGGEEGLEPPTDCGVEELSYTYRLEGRNSGGGGNGSEPLENSLFINRLSDDLGRLEIFGAGGTARIFLEFDEPLVSPGEVAVRGFVKLPTSVDAGHCESGGFSGRLTELDTGDGWAFSLVGLHEAPYCDGEELDGSFAACYRHQ